MRLSGIVKRWGVSSVNYSILGKRPNGSVSGGCGGLVFFRSPNFLDRPNTTVPRKSYGLNVREILLNIELSILIKYR